MDDMPNVWGTTATSTAPSTLTLEELREVLDLLRPAPFVLMPTPHLPRGTLYVEKKPGCFLPLKERAHVVLIHTEDVATVQESFRAAGQPVPRVGSVDDLKSREPPPMRVPALVHEPEPLTWHYGWRLWR